MNARPHEISVEIQPGLTIGGTLCVPPSPIGIVVLAHASASGRRTSPQRETAATLERVGLATLELDLLTVAEEHAERLAGAHSHREKQRLDVPLLAGRLLRATSWLRKQPETYALPVGYLGSGLVGAAALVAAAHEPARVRAVVACSSRIDLAGDDLAEVDAPILLLVGSADVPVMAATRATLKKLHCKAELELIPGVAHRFEQPGAFEVMALHARNWFLQHLPLAQAFSREAPASRREPSSVAAAR